MEAANHFAPPSKPFQRKARGWIVLNGNVVEESNLIEMFQKQILHPDHFDSAVDERRKVLLVTAAFNKGEEHRDRHLIQMFEKVGIDAGWENHLPQNIQNLSIYTMFRQFQEREPWIYRRYTEKQDIIKAITWDSGDKSQHHVEAVHRILGRLRDHHSPLGLYDFYHACSTGRGLESLQEEEESGSHPQRKERLEALKALSRSQADRDRCEELHRTIEHIVYKDEEVFAMCRAVEEHFLEKSGVRSSSLYRQQRAELRERILSSATVFLFGGRVFVLMNRLRFYDLAPVFREALWEGTNLFGISAGAMCMTERVSLAFDELDDGGSRLHAADFGMGLVRGIRIFPHADDVRAIREGRRDDLSFFALRMPREIALGLNENSVVLSEAYRDPVDDDIYTRISAMGSDPVLVFGTRGERHEMQPGSEILVEGSKFYDGRPQLATRQDIAQLEEDWREDYALGRDPDMPFQN